MIKKSLRMFAEQIFDNGVIGEEDVRDLQNDILANGLMHREEADVLIAIDRLVEDQCLVWGEALVHLLIDFCVWGARPTGYVDSDTASWLTTSLSAAGGPTPNGVRAAFEVVREAQQVDEALITFVLQSMQAERSAKANRAHAAQQTARRETAQPETARQETAQETPQADASGDERIERGRRADAA